MNEKISGPYTLEQIRQMKDETDWERLRAEGDFEGEDEDDFEVDWDKAVLVIPSPKKLVSLRIDADVLDFFKGQGKGYQTRMNAVLRAYMQARRAS